MRTLRLPGVLIGLGFAGIVLWTAAYLAAVLPTFDAAATTVYWLTTTAGYGMAGYACWRWIAGSWKTEDGGATIRGPVRWMAAASVVTAAGVATLTYTLYQHHPSLSLGTLDFHYGLRLAGDIAGTVGFLLAAVGFWIASTARPTEPGAEHARTSALGGTPMPGGVPESNASAKV
ncbi:MAG TPA: hypothetical protein VIJ56_02605 [Acidimicrobiales bacterium]